MKSKRQRIWVGAAILFWLSVGIALPSFFEFSGDEFQLDNAEVVAAPRDSFLITSTLVLDDISRATATGGTLAMAGPKAPVLNAEASAALLESGNAVLLLDGSELSIGGALPSVASNVVEASAPLVRALQSGKFKALGLRQSTIIVALPNGHIERLTRATAQVVRSSNGTVEAKGTGFWRGQRSEFTLKSGQIDKEGNAPIELTFKATLLNVSYSGTYTLKGDKALHGPAAVHLKNTEKLANALGTSWPIGTNVQDIRIEGPLRWKNSTLAFDQAEVSVGGNDARGTVSLNTSAAQALIASTLAFDKLDIAPYLPVSATDHTAIAWQWWNKLVGTLSQPAAPHINADIRLSTKTLISGKQTLGPAAATISMKDGKLSADIAEMTLNNGRATGQISIDFNRFIPKLALRGQIEDIATGNWSEQLTGKRYMEGRGRMIADLTSQGASIQQIVADLTGQVEFAIPENGKIGLNVAELETVHDKTKWQSTNDILARSQLGTTSINDLEGVWTIKDGIATIAKASIRHATGTLRLRGNYDMTRHTFNLRVLSVANSKSSSTKATVQAKPTARANPSNSTMQLPISATLLSIKRTTSNEQPQNTEAQALQFQLRALNGTKKEIQSFLGPNSSKMSDSSL